jgi:hypothetical protein
LLDNVVPDVVIPVKPEPSPINVPAIMEYADKVEVAIVDAVMLDAIIVDAIILDVLKEEL